MKIVVAPDSFKESLTAMEVAQAIERGIKKVSFGLEVKTVPMADGGEGTVQALVDATSGSIIKSMVKDPLNRDIASFYGILGDGMTAVIEMAAASGLDLLQDTERNPEITTTYGTGQLMLHALEAGCKKLIIGIGGSATNDGGAGMAQALGASLLDSHGQQIKLGGGFLNELAQIDLTDLDLRVNDTEILVACDVTNPLTGPNGASIIYGPQKGADKEMVQKLDQNLGHLAQCIESDLEISVGHVPGAGAAGGLGAGLMAFLQAELSPGFDIISETVNLNKVVQGADLVITGEGRIDHQTQFGKTPFGVAQVAKKYNKPVIAITGSIGQGVDELYAKGIDSVFSIVDKPMNLADAMVNAAVLLESAAERIVRLFMIHN